MYDLAIIGGGPAAISAAINAKITDKNFIWLGQKSQKAARAELVKNYPGLPDISGEQLVWALGNHAASLGITPKDMRVLGVYKTGDYFSLLTEREDFEAAAVILCIGVSSIKCAEGEERLLGRGVSYCATCDGMLYRGKKIAIICHDKKFEHEAEYLFSIAGEVVFSPLYKDCKLVPKNGEILMKTPTAFVGDDRLERVVYGDTERAVDGAFILKSSLSPSALVHGIEIDGGHIVVDRALRTNIAGIFAAGDCTGRPYQYAKAVGEGNVALHSAIEYIAAIKK